MRRVIISIGLLLLWSSAGLPVGAYAAASPPADLESFLSSLRARDSSPRPTQTSASRGRRNITTKDVTCITDCGPYGQLTCTTSGSCTAVNRNCSVGQQGYLNCNGSYRYCPVCPCIEGDWRQSSGGCCPGGQQEVNEYMCINGQWELIATNCFGTCF